MFDLLIACAIALALCGSAFLGRALHHVLPEHHRSTGTFDFVRAASGLVVTFTALVLSLLLTTVSTDFNKADTDLHTYASMIIVLDREMADLGPAADAPRAVMKRYTAAAIASTWPEEPAPAAQAFADGKRGSSTESVLLGNMLYEVEADLRRIVPDGDAMADARASCLRRISALLDQRWDLISESHSSIPSLYSAMMGFWLFAVFLSFGLTAPQNRTASVSIGLAALSVAGAVFLIIEFDGPLDGLIKVQSEPLRHALRSLGGGTGGPS